MEIIIMLIILVLFALYLAPCLYAHTIGHKNAVAITWLNLLLGWTFIGWVVCLVWSVMDDSVKNEKTII